MCNTAGRLRRLPEVECLFPKTVKEAISLLQEHTGTAIVVAGGTDVVIKMKKRLYSPKYAVDLKGISGLNYIDDGGNGTSGLRIGALTTLSDVLESSQIRKSYPMLIDAVSVMASPQIRNTATVVGNLCNAVPSADAAPPLIALGAILKIEGPKGERAIELENFFAGPSVNVLQPGEIVTEITIPPLASVSGGAYLKQMLRAEMDLAVVGVAAYIALSGKKDSCADIRIALGAVAPTPIRAKKAEEALKGKKLNADSIERAAAIAADESKPIDDIRSSAEYRKEIVRVLTKRAILQAKQRV